MRSARRPDAAGHDARAGCISSIAATKPYKNAVAIDGTGIDTRTDGGYVVLPLPGNGREWLRPLIGAPLLPAPAWLDCAVKKAPSTRAPLTLAPRVGARPAVVRFVGAEEGAGAA